jgi:hypothetical protein
MEEQKSTFKVKCDMNLKYKYNFSFSTLNTYPSFNRYLASRIHTLTVEGEFRRQSTTDLVVDEQSKISVLGDLYSHYDMSVQWFLEQGFIREVRGQNDTIDLEWTNDPHQFVVQVGQQNATQTWLQKTLNRKNALDEPDDPYLTRQAGFETFDQTYIGNYRTTLNCLILFDYMSFLSTAKHGMNKVFSLIGTNEIELFLTLESTYFNQFIKHIILSRPLFFYVQGIQTIFMNHVNFGSDNPSTASDPKRKDFETEAKRKKNIQNWSHILQTRIQFETMFGIIPFVNLMNNTLYNWLKSNLVLQQRVENYNSDSFDFEEELERAMSQMGQKLEEQLQVVENLKNSDLLLKPFIVRPREEFKSPYIVFNEWMNESFKTKVTIILGHVFNTNISFLGKDKRANKIDGVTTKQLSWNIGTQSHVINVNTYYGFRTCPADALETGRSKGGDILESYKGEWDFTKQPYRCANLIFIELTTSANQVTIKPVMFRFICKVSSTFGLKGKKPKLSQALSLPNAPRLPYTYKEESYQPLNNIDWNLLITSMLAYMDDHTKMYAQHQLAIELELLRTLQQQGQVYQEAVQEQEEEKEREEKYQDQEEALRLQEEARRLQQQQENLLFDPSLLDDIELDPYFAERPDTQNQPDYSSYLSSSDEGPSYDSTMYDRPLLTPTPLDTSDFDEQMNLFYSSDNEGQEEESRKRQKTKN